MGTLYKEVVEYKYYKFLKHVLIAATTILALDIIYLTTDLKKIIEEFLYVGYGLMPMVILATLLMYGRCKKRYRYVIIDNELIIERLNGNKRKPILNLNIKQIMELEKVRTRTEDDGIDKVYNFACTFKENSVYRCVFVRDGKLISFYFEPSSKLIGKISSMIPERITA